MKIRKRKSFGLSITIAVLGSVLAAHLTGQTLTVLHNFSPNVDPYYNIEGASPAGGLVLSGMTLYGTAESGGPGALAPGTVFAVNTDGTGFSVLHAFTGYSDGCNPTATLVVSANTLYGTAHQGGGTNGSNGTVFGVNTDGTGFTNLYVFSDQNDGRHPVGGLVLSGNILYGTVAAGGSGAVGSYGGTVFAVNTDGSGFRTVHSFASGDTNLSGVYTNSDGASPLTGLLLSGNTLYGTTFFGGSGGNGTIFAVKTNGADFTVLHSFTPACAQCPNSDGANPRAELILSGNTLYGTTIYGGSSGSGTVFKLNTDGTGFTTLYDFTALPNVYSSNLDGAYPRGQLLLLGQTLYGTASLGGSSGTGTIFTINTDGTGFTVFYNFSPIPPGWAYPPNGDGALPYSGLLSSDSALYGTAFEGGTFGAGTVFSISLPPPPPELTLTLSGPNVILTWSTNTAGYNLQSTFDLTPPALWSPVYPAPVVVNGQNTVTNPIAAGQQFYRLSQ